MAWLGVMRRINHMLKFNFDLTDLEEKSRHLVELMDNEIEEIQKNSKVDLKAYMDKLGEDFVENPFTPQDMFWEEKLKGLFDRLDSDDSQE